MCVKVSVSESGPPKRQPPGARKISIGALRRDSADTSVTEELSAPGGILKKRERPSVLVESPEASRRASMAGVTFIEV